MLLIQLVIGLGPRVWENGLNEPLKLIWHWSMFVLCLIWTEVQPPVTNLSVSVENLCTIVWTWSPPEGANPNCTLRYLSHFDDKQDKVSVLEPVPLLWCSGQTLWSKRRMSQILISKVAMLLYVVPRCPLGRPVETTINKIEHLKIFANSWWLNIIDYPNRKYWIAICIWHPISNQFHYWCLLLCSCL